MLITWKAILVMAITQLRSMSCHHINHFVSVESKKFQVHLIHEFATHWWNLSCCWLQILRWLAIQHFVTKCKSLATMSSNLLGVQINFRLGLAKPPKLMTPPHLQTTWAFLLHGGQDCLPLPIIKSFRKPSFAIHLSTAMQWVNQRNVYPFWECVKPNKPCTPWH